MLGMFKRALAGTTEEELRGICVRVGFSFLAIGGGSSAEDAMHTEYVTDEDLANLIGTLQGMRASLATREVEGDEIVVDAADDDDDDAPEEDEGNPFILSTEDGTEGA
jgi:hypothetical protein